MSIVYVPLMHLKPMDAKTWFAYPSYNLTIRALYHRHVVCNVPVSCKSIEDRNQYGAWLDSDLIVV